MTKPTKAPQAKLAPPIAPLWNTKRVLYSWLCVSVVSATCALGASFEARDASIRSERADMHQWRDTFITNATYAGCGHKDQVGGFSFNPFPTAIDAETGEPYALAISAKPNIAKRARTKGEKP